ncbi:nitrate- and nitrite sensing domain-containing protein [Micromonospora endolithica]|uniref:histidine kinase n=1 Tax=Micromonospora endolithica TaxID=230091 RepID=A0A3A9Z1H4_9ACTN|nr:nitrate- and nitrite sensing domain-containing protein [Micromonospora endolithica]RKN42025.1 HAMP domain-containing protein [Micromonospora endolithica]TWJ26258.1 signal transduction histidine kinase [Micromonospora endolithica]
MNTRDWPIRSKLTALVVVPVTALLALWIFATTLTFGPALDLLAARTLLYDLGRPGETVVAELQRERRLSVIQLSGTGMLPNLAEQRQRTDRAVIELRRRISGDDLRDAAGDLLDTRLDQLVAALDALPVGRDFIDRRQVDRAGAVGLYSGMVTSAFQAFAAMAALPDAELNRQALAVTALGRSRELLGQVDALLAGAFTSGRFAEGEHAQVVQAVANHRYLVDAAVADLPPTERAAYQRLTEQEAFGQLRTLLDTVVAVPERSRPAVTAASWIASYDQVQQSMRAYELDQADGLAERSVPTAVTILVRLAAAGLLGLAAVVVAIVVALRVGRSLAARLTAVRTAALETAEHRLPDVVARLRRGEQVDVAREAPPLEYGADEIGQVGRAFTQVQRTAVQAAVDEVALRRGLNEVFLNIARRSQGLVHRQLALLDKMERGTEDPDELAALFGVDHLATRLRRHAEDLVILAGSPPGRGWRQPVAMVDLIRGAIGEVESYDRVDIAAVTPAGTAGRAVGDLMHLLAELIENATAFSPPDTRVVVSGQPVANGYAIEVTDHGLGMSPAALDNANRRLSRSPEFDPAETARLGLFVVARLAARHGVRVRLRASEESGLTAVVLIPTDLVTDEPALPVDPAPAAAGTRRRTTVPRPRATRPAPPVPAGAAPDRVALAGPAPSELGGEIDGLPRRVRRPAPGAPTAPAVGSPAAPPPVPADAVPTAGPATVAGAPTGADGPADVAGRPADGRPPVDGPTVRQPALASPTPRSPDEARRVMAALQAGTARGRREAVRPPGAAAPGTDPEPPTTTERDA